MLNGCLELLGRKVRTVGSGANMRGRSEVTEALRTTLVNDLNHKRITTNTVGLFQVYLET